MRIFLPGLRWKQGTMGTRCTIRVFISIQYFFFFYSENNRSLKKPPQGHLESPSWEAFKSARKAHLGSLSWKRLDNMIIWGHFQPELFYDSLYVSMLLTWQQHLSISVPNHICGVPNPWVTGDNLSNYLTKLVKEMKIVNFFVCLGMVLFVCLFFLKLFL